MLPQLSQQCNLPRILNLNESYACSVSDLGELNHMFTQEKLKPTESGGVYPWAAVGPTLPAYLLPAP